MIDTIYALATPPGRSGVAVIRVSGPAALTSLQVISSKEVVEPRQAILCVLTHPVSRETIDRALVIFFAGPASFTGEDVAEYHVHGGMAVIQSLLEALSQQDNHRMAEPGEFTKRGFENNKFDLTEAEAVADLINAETHAQKEQALQQMGGALSSLYDGWRKDLTHAMAYAEADIDFSDEDLPDGVLAQVHPVLQRLSSEMQDHLADNRRGERLRNGIQVAVIGAPNAGKSSLVNALSQRDVAIVSAAAGTTRDVIEAHLDIGGFPVILADTAGLRPDQLGDTAQDNIESEGIRRAMQRAQDADIRLLLFDAEQLPNLDHHTMTLVDEHALIVVNKIDRTKDPKLPEGAITISAETGEGLDRLLDEMVLRIKALIGHRETPSLTRQRHRKSLSQTIESMQRALDGTMPELVAEDIRLAIRHLGRITGRVDVEDLLDVIFRDFCIGK